MNEIITTRKARLGLICLIYIVISIPLYIILRHFIYRWLAWNLFLAYLPLVFSTLVRITGQRSGKFYPIAATLLWIVFFPNAPYMVTDLIHISSFHFYSNLVGTDKLLAWAGLIYIVIGVMLGMLVGLLSLEDMFREIHKIKGRGIAVIAMIGISLASGYAVYIGRFLRFNSWDILRPLSLIRRLVEDFSLFTVQYSLLIAGFVGLSYFIFRMMCVRQPTE